MTIEPDVIITHHPNDYHTDHLEISKLVSARMSGEVAR